MKPKYNEGDTVEILFNYTGHDLEIGSEVVIDHIHQEGTDLAYYGNGWYFEEDECIKVNK